LHQLGKGQKKSSKEEIILNSLVIFSIICFIGSIFVSGRFASFFYISSTAVAALGIKILIKRNKIVIDPKFRKVLLISITAFLVIAVYNSSRSLEKKAKNPSYEIFKDSAEWIDERSNQADIVFLDNWSFFPVLFFYNHKNYYTVGLEPKALYKYDQELFWKWYNIRYNQYLCGKVGDCKEERSKALKKINTVKERDDFEKAAAEEMVASIKNDFGADFIFSHDVKLNRVLVKNEELFADYKQIKDRKNKNSYVRVFQLK
jgi:hypothetical protein